jgi:hypothetical protein
MTQRSVTLRPAGIFGGTIYLFQGLPSNFAIKVMKYE